MMWTSYSALCEMGYVTSSNTDLDPVSVFGVIPPNLTKIPQSKGGYGPETIMMGDGFSTSTSTSANTQYNNIHDHYDDNITSFTNNPKSIENKKFLSRIREMGTDNNNNNNNNTQSPFHIMNASPIMTSFETTGVGMGMHPGHSVMEGGAGGGYHNQSSFIPQTPFARNFTMQGTGDHHHHHDNSSLQATSLFPQTTELEGRGGSGNNNNNNGNLPSTTLFATPGLTPIPHDQPQQQYLGFSSGKKEEVFSRARQIASRLYYDSSLEITPPCVDALTSNKTPSPPHSESSAKSSMKTARRRQFRSRTDFLMSVDETKQDEYNDQRMLFDGNEGGKSRNLDEDMELALGDEGTEIENTDRENPVTATTHDVHEKRVETEESGDDQGVQHILELFCTLGAAQRMLCSFHCKEAIQIYRSLPNNQYNTGFVQHQIGRAYFEMADYPNAQRAFELMQRVESYR